VITAPGVTVENLEVVGSGEGDRKDHTAVFITGSGVTLRNLRVTGAWAGVWFEGGRRQTLEGFRFEGPRGVAFWQRGEGVRAVKTEGLTLKDLDLRWTNDGVYLESVADASLEGARIDDSRYAVHAMFGRGGRISAVTSRRHVVGVMLMETQDYLVRSSTLREGYRLGSAGLRLIRTSGVRVEDVTLARNAAGVEFVDARNGLVTRSRIEENTVAWAWGGDNRGSRITDNVHRGNLTDVSASEPDLPLVPRDHPHPEGADPALAPTGAKVRPEFDGNFWDAWKGWDLDGDGFGDTAYRFDPAAAGRLQSRPWTGLFLGSPWSLLSAGLPGGEVLDGRPRVVRAP